MISKKLLCFTDFLYLKLKYRQIDKFPSDEMPEPPSCIVKVYAKDRSESKEVFHFLVPLEGVVKPPEIVIHLSQKRSPNAGSFVYQVDYS